MRSPAGQPRIGARFDRPSSRLSDAKGRDMTIAGRHVLADELDIATRDPPVVVVAPAVGQGMPQSTRAGASDLDMPIQAAQGAVGLVGRDLGRCGRELLLGPEQLRPKTTAVPLLGSLGLAFRHHGGSNPPPRQRRGPSRNAPLETWCRCGHTEARWTQSEWPIQRPRTSNHGQPRHAPCAVEGTASSTTPGCWTGHRARSVP
jgi:hypothetical protein